MGHTKVSRESALGVSHTGTKDNFLKRETRGFESRDTDMPNDVLVFRFDWFTSNIAQFDSKYTCRFLIQVGSLATRRQENLHPLIK